MDYKKKYEQAMLRMNKWVEGSEIVDPKEVAEFVFPELKESEDEGVRKELVQYLKDYPNLPNGNYCRDDFFAWLEKQGEHANFRNKIQIGDEVTRNEDGELVNLSQFKRMVKQGEQKIDFCHHEVDFSDCSDEYRKAYYDGWNNCNQQHAQLKAEQKPAWSEEDEGMCIFTIKILNNIHYKDNANWLKSLKERYGWKPSEEQMEALWNAIPHIPNSEKDIDTITELSVLYNDLKKLKEEWL